MKKVIAIGIIALTLTSVTTYYNSGYASNPKQDTKGLITDRPFDLNAFLDARSPGARTGATLQTKFARLFSLDVVPFIPASPPIGFTPVYPTPDYVSTIDGDISLPSDISFFSPPGLTESTPSFPQTPSTPYRPPFVIGNPPPPLGSVPEVSTWIMMLLGFGIVGYCLRKRILRQGLTLWL